MVVRLLTRCTWCAHWVPKSLKRISCDFSQHSAWLTISHRHRDITRKLYVRPSPSLLICMLVRIGRLLLELATALLQSKQYIYKHISGPQTQTNLTESDNLIPPQSRFAWKHWTVINLIKDLTYLLYSLSKNTHCVYITLYLFSFLFFSSFLFSFTAGLWWTWLKI